MRAFLIVVGVIDLAVAIFVVPTIGIAYYSTSAVETIKTYPRLSQENGEPTFSAEESQLLKSMEQRSANIGFTTMAFIGGQGILLIIAGIALRSPILRQTTE